MLANFQAIVEEMEVDQDAHTCVAFTYRAAFDRAWRAIDYAERSTADHVVVYDPEGNILWPEEART